MISPQINIGPITFHLYGFIIALAIFFGWLLAKKRAHLYKIPVVIFEDSVLLTPLVLSIIFARIYHIVDYWRVYKTNPISIIYIFNGGLGIWGALIGAFIGFYIVSKLKKISLLSILDLTAPSFLLAQAIGRIGNYINQEGFGPPTSLPWAVYINPQNRPEMFNNYSYFHPTFFYEAILDFIFFVLLILISKKIKKPGQVFSSYLILYSIGRAIAEFFRIDTWQIGSVKVAYVLSVVTLLLGLLLVFYYQNKAKTIISTSSKNGNKRG